MIKRISILLAALMLVFPLCSCRGYRETDSEYFVSAVCFEKKENEFKAYSEVIVMSEENKNPSNKVFTSTGKTPYAAVSAVTALMPKKAVFDHCSTAIISSNITGKDFKSVIKYLYDIKNLNLSIYLFVSDDIDGILNCKAQTLSVGYDIAQIESNIVKSSGISFKNKYYEICSREISTGGFCLPMVSKKNDCPRFSGQTVYAGYRPAAQLNQKQTMLYNLLFSGSKGGEIEVGNCRCRVNGISSSIKAYGDTLNVKIKCRYRHRSDDKSTTLKSEIKGFAESLYNNAALKVLGATDFEKIDKVEISVNGK